MLPPGQRTATAFDHGHGAWEQLLRQRGVVAAGGNSSAVRYAGMKRQQAALRAYLDTLAG